MRVALAALALFGASVARPPIHLASPSRLPVVETTRGPNDPHDFDLSLLVPRGARLRQLWYIHGGRQPDQVLVEWIRSPHVSLYDYVFPDSVRWGLTLWTQEPRRLDFEAPWKGVALPLLKTAPGAPDLRVGLADVTGDGHPDVLVEQDPHTNHGCGLHEVVATMADGSTWQVFRAAPLCETTLRGYRGLLALDLPFYGPKDSVCCPSKVEKVRLRWAGRRYTVVSDRLVRNR